MKFSFILVILQILWILLQNLSVWPEILKVLCLWGRKILWQSRKREQKVWLGSKQVYHLDDDQHQQNQSRIQALLLSISSSPNGGRYGRGRSRGWGVHQQNMTLFNINVIKNTNESKKLLHVFVFLGNFRCF